MLEMEIIEPNVLEMELTGQTVSTIGGTTNYNELTEKPKINNIELEGNKTLEDLGIQPKGNYVIDNNYVHTDNNYTTVEKNKLSSLSNYDDTEIRNALSNKANILDIPTKTSQLTNDSDFATNSYVNKTILDVLGNVNEILSTLVTIEESD